MEVKSSVSHSDCSTNAFHKDKEREEIKKPSNQAKSHFDIDWPNRTAAPTNWAVLRLAA